MFDFCRTTIGSNFVLFSCQLPRPGCNEASFESVDDINDARRWTSFMTPGNHAICQMLTEMTRSVNTSFSTPQLLLRELRYMPANVSRSGLRLVYPVSAVRIRINFWRMVGIHISFGDWANALECWRSPSLRLVIPGIEVSPGVTHSDSRIVFVTGTVVKPQQPTTNIARAATRWVTLFSFEIVFSWLSSYHLYTKLHIANQTKTLYIFEKFSSSIVIF